MVQLAGCREGRPGQSHARFGTLGGHRCAGCWSSVRLHPFDPALRHPELSVRLTQTAGQGVTSVRPEPCCPAVWRETGAAGARQPSVAWPRAGLVALQVAALPCGCRQEHECCPNSSLLPSVLGCSDLFMTPWVHGAQWRRAGLAARRDQSALGKHRSELTRCRLRQAGLSHCHPRRSAMESLWMCCFCSRKQSSKAGPKEDLARESALRLGTCSPGPLPSAAYQGKQENLFSIQLLPGLGVVSSSGLSPSSTQAVSGSAKL